MNKFLKWAIVLSLLLVMGLISAETSQAASTAVTYNLTFTSVWSPDSHDPNTIPLPAGAHWSRLVGATHTNTSTLWQNGSVASTGIRRMAEWGWNQPLNDEVDALITANAADQWIQFPTSLGSASGTLNHSITVNNAFPYLSLVSMIAPSPDWFVGIDRLALQDGNGDWKASITTDLYIFDAGTDAGTQFTSPNNENLGNPISNKHGVATFSSAPIGTLTLTRNTPTAINLTAIQTTTYPSQLLLLCLILLALGYISFQTKIKYS